MDKIILTSTAFKSKEFIPIKYTCDGENVSPPLLWKNVPKETKSLVLIVDDPDAPRKAWVHWLVYNIPPEIDCFPENMQSTAELVAKIKIGRNDFNNNSYGGPCPPSGTHRYFFKLYSLNTLLNLPSGKTKSEVEKAMENHIIGSGELIGLYPGK
jgi:Raf kinase inhibitor-like YbhB/YbcL family protein